ncbi:MAG: MarR family transcriptional regulator, partial [Pseudomonas taetrolens]
ASDRRAKTLSLTESGRVLAQSIEAQLVQLRRAALAGVSLEDQQAALRVINAFEAAGQLRDGETS